MKGTSHQQNYSRTGFLVTLGICLSFILHSYARTEISELTVELEHAMFQSSKPETSNSKVNYTFYGEEKPQLECLGSEVEECTDELIKSDIMSKLPLKLRAQVNLTRTGPIKIVNGKTCPRISRKLDTACPYQIRHSANSSVEMRLPNAIGLGTHKSGTGALAFLDCHPDLVIRILEPNAFPKVHKRLYFDNDQFLLPLTHSSEFLVEKSPVYAERFKRRTVGKQSLVDLKSGNFETVKRAVEMAKISPTVKLFIHVTDPVGRLYSQITQIFRPEMARIRFRLKEHKTVSSAIEKAINYIELNLNSTTENIVPAYIDELENGEEQIGWYLRLIIQIGNYYDTIRDYETAFGKHAVHVVDGHNEIAQPNDEFKRLLKFFNLDQSMIEFKFNEQKGFYCLDKPVKFCLSKEKGHRGKTDIYEAYPGLAVVKRAYRDQMFKLYEHLMDCTSVEECCLDTSDRFTWMKSYFCD